MKAAAITAKDPVCGMTVDVVSTVHAERDGKTYYFCGDTCMKKFLSAPNRPAKNAKKGDCCA